MPCTSTMIATNQFVPNYLGLALDKLNCISNCLTSAGGYTSIDVIPRCTDASISVGVSVGQRSDVVYLLPGSNFSIAYQNYAWLPLATALVANWSISTWINLAVRPDNGRYNNAPVSTLISPINIVRNQATVIQIPVGDTDGDDLRCRWSRASSGVDECGQVCPPGSLPIGTVLFPNCTMIITGQSILDWFAITVMV